ncbi:MAG: flagellar synthesis regulator FleN [Deltaproteobacteria bacterium HGW-Deltaproteobacteria-15]|nr:MAG: flagellar synthesis regulator FleN [Deltaproteobacteria bacterium HGW-Deltaproteobacteria-15]
MDQASRLRGAVRDLKAEASNPALRNRGMMRRNQSPKTIRVISVTSGKGGVGKTSVVANLALALCRMNKRVLILDADLGLANMDVMLGLNPRYTIQNVLKREKRIEEVIVTAPGGFKLLPAASGIQELTELDNGERLFLLNELDSIQDRFDVLLIDTAAGISSNVMYFNFAAMEKVVVVTNEPTSLTDAYALIKVLNNKYHQKRFKVLVNSARSASEADRIYRNLGLVADQFLGSPSLDYLGWIPYDKMVPASIRQQQMVLQRYPDTPASKSFVSLAEKLMGKEEEQAFAGDIRFFWRRLLKV